jgi:hypothetical protein
MSMTPVGKGTLSEWGSILAPTSEGAFTTHSLQGDISAALPEANFGNVAPTVGNKFGKLATPIVA